MQTIGRTVGRVFIGMCLWGIGLCVLFGCTASAPAFPVAEHFRCEADVVCGGERFSGTLVRGAAGTLRWEMTAPESVRGCSFGWDGEALTLTAQGLSFAVEPTSLPETAPVWVLVTALEAVSRMDRQTPPTAAEDGAHTVGACSAGAFVLLSDPATGALRALSVPERAVEIRFSAFVGTNATSTPKKGQ